MGIYFTRSMYVTIFFSVFVSTVELAAAMPKWSGQFQQSQTKNKTNVTVSDFDRTVDRILRLLDSNDFGKLNTRDIDQLNKDIRWVLPSLIQRFYNISQDPQNSLLLQDKDSLDRIMIKLTQHPIGLLLLRGQSGRTFSSLMKFLDSVYVQDSNNQELIPLSEYLYVSNPVMYDQILKGKDLFRTTDYNVLIHKIFDKSHALKKSPTAYVNECLAQVNDSFNLFTCVDGGLPFSVPSVDTMGQQSSLGMPRAVASVEPVQGSYVMPPSATVRRGVAPESSGFEDSFVSPSRAERSSDLTSARRDDDLKKALESFVQALKK